MGFGNCFQHFAKPELIRCWLSRSCKDERTALRSLKQSLALLELRQLGDQLLDLLGKLLLRRLHLMLIESNSLSLDRSECDRRLHLQRLRKQSVALLRSWGNLRPKRLDQFPGDRATSGITKSQLHIIIGILAGLLVAQLFGLTSTQKSTIEWEYIVDSPSDTTLRMELDRLGGRGWELVFARRATSEFGSPSYEMIFRRPKR